MPQTTPFHERLLLLNETGIWKNWSGYLVAPKYQYSTISEYYAIRNSVAVLDTSPLFKYRIHGPYVGEFLQRFLARDIRNCDVGQAHYTCWCDDAGFVVQDGVILRVDENEFWLTSAEPSLRYLQDAAAKHGVSDVEVEDVSTEFGILAVQGPHSLTVLGQLCDGIEKLGYFDVCRCQMNGHEVIVSRTGFTGDLGYEVWCKATAANSVWDAIWKAGQDYNIMPLGTTALKMARVEAGLLLLDVDFHSSRFAWVDAQRETPCELGWRWMLRKLDQDDRQFTGREAIEKQVNEKTERWTTVGLQVDWHSYEAAFTDAGIMPDKAGVYCESTMSIYSRGKKEWDYAGYASSFLYSSLLRKPIAIAKLPLDLAKRGTEVDLEINVIRKPVNVLARVSRMPFFNPERKTSEFE